MVNLSDCLHTRNREPPNPGTESRCGAPGAGAGWVSGELATTGDRAPVWEDANVLEVGEGNTAQQNVLTAARLGT